MVNGMNEESHVCVTCKIDAKPARALGRCMLVLPAKTYSHSSLIRSIELNEVLSLQVRQIFQRNSEHSRAPLICFIFFTTPIINNYFIFIINDNGFYLVLWVSILSCDNFLLSAECDGIQYYTLFLVFLPTTYIFSKIFIGIG